MVAKLPPKLATVPTCGYQTASKKGGVKIARFIKVLTMRLGASCLPVATSRI